MENLKDIQVRHEKEIKTLRKNCRHEWVYDKYPNGDVNLMRWVCPKCGGLKSRPFTIKF